jgi:hypothetical protein
VLEWAEAGLRAVPEDAVVLEVERSFSHIRSTRSRIPGVALVGHVDLVIEHREGIVEHIEFKTGWAQPDPIQDVICRIGVCETFAKPGRPILSSIVQLTSGELFMLDGDRDELRRILPTIEQTVLDIWDAETWPARENPHCIFCEYATTLCSLRGAWSRRARPGE